MGWKIINRTNDGKIIKDLSKVILPKELQQFLDESFSLENLNKEGLGDEELQRKIS